MSLDIYAEELVSHYEYPHNKGAMPQPSASKKEDNVSCGDVITIYLKIEDGKVTDAMFDGAGCAISTASASMLTDFLKGKKLDEIEQMGAHTIVKVLGVDPGLSRMHCATLPLRAAKEAVFEYERK